MKTSLVLVLALLVLVGTEATSAPEVDEERGREVVIAIRRDHRLHVFDARTLDALGSVAINNQAHRIQASPDGRTIFVAQSATLNGNGCCALFALDLATGAMCRLIEPVTGLVVSADGRWVFTQRGNTGIDLFNARTLERQPTVAVPGVYRLRPSPDGRWLIGITTWPTPSLDVVDLEQQTLVRRLPLPDGWSDGAWLGDRFHLYTSAGGSASLQTFTGESDTLGPVQPVALSAALANDRLPTGPELVASKDRLYVYEPLGWWFKGDARSRGEAADGGLLAIDPASGTVTARLASSVELAQVVASGASRRLYGVDAGEPYEGRTVRLLALDADSGAVVADRELPSDVWSIALATLPEALVPTGEVQSVNCQRPEPTPFAARPPPPTALPPAASAIR